MPNHRRWERLDYAFGTMIEIPRAASAVSRSADCSTSTIVALPSGSRSDSDKHRSGRSPGSVYEWTLTQMSPWPGHAPLVNVQNRAQTSELFGRYLEMFVVGPQWVRSLSQD
jgi:hypothetical protein